MICQGWRRLGEMQESLRRPYYQMLVRQLAQGQDFVAGRGWRRPLSPPSRATSNWRSALGRRPGRMEGTDGDSRRDSGYSLQGALTQKA